MSKNTVLAIVLSSIVLIGSYILIPIIFAKDAPENNTVAEETQDTENVKETNTTDNAAANNASLFKSENEATSEISPDEKHFTIKTDKAEIVLTNKGGDIISYKLMDHKDTDTGDGVQLSDNISNINRTCAIAFGPSGKDIVQDIFNVEQIDKYTYLFTKTMNVDGHDIILGKKYTFMEGEYVFKLDILIHDKNGTGLDKDGVAYTIRTSPQIGPHFDPKKNRYESRQFIAFNGNKVKRKNIAGNQITAYEKDFNWAAVAGKYFTEIVIPNDSGIIKSASYSSKIEVDNYANAQAMLERRGFSGSDIMDTYYMYFGPRNEDDLKRYNVSEKNGWNLNGHNLISVFRHIAGLSGLKLH